MKTALLAALAACAVPARAQHSALYGSYPLSRDASGTAWQPDSTPHEAWHHMAGPWMVMAHGWVWGLYDDQGGPRGDEKAFSQSMFMLTARRELAGGTFGLKGMASLDPAMGKTGYPLLLQTGETADGRTPLVDRQHPHDLFMELAATYSRPVSGEASVFGYLALAGEPALGPPVFMMRASGMDNPEAPITHHWFDSTHVAYGVATAGAVWKGWKLEGSAFQGREPDQYRWDIEAPKFDSFSGRLSCNPTPDWSLQVSFGRLESPEQLEPDRDQERLTASASRNFALRGGMLHATAGWSRLSDPAGGRGPALDAFLFESAFRFTMGHALFGRFEWVQKNELFPAGAPQAGETFDVAKLSLGGLYEFADWRRVHFGAGGVGSLSFVPSGLRGAYGDLPLSFMLFVRARLG